MGKRMKVVRNRVGEYSIWPADRENPLGWNDVGKEGLAEQCLEYIEEVWTDMRPLSLRQRSQKLREMEQKVRRDSGR